MCQLELYNMNNQFELIYVHNNIIHYYDNYFTYHSLTDKYNIYILLIAVVSYNVNRALKTGFTH